MRNKNAHSVPDNDLAHVSLCGRRVAPRKGMAQAHKYVYWSTPHQSSISQLIDGRIVPNVAVQNGASRCCARILLKVVAQVLHRSY